MPNEALTGMEVKECVLRRFRELMDQCADLSAIYAYPRVSFKGSITITPYYGDESPIHIDAAGEIGDGPGEPREPKEFSFEQGQVNDPDSLRPEKVQAPEVPEEESKEPGKVNPMVRFG